MSHGLFFVQLKGCEPALSADRLRAAGYELFTHLLIHSFTHLLISKCIRRPCRLQNPSILSEVFAI
jgi:hypothetical protein